jgi:hypothetical protein
MGEDSGLAATGAGQHQYGAITVGDSVFLLRVEWIEDTRDLALLAGHDERKLFLSGQ